MTERGASFEPKGSLRDLLSDEEFREILAPFPGDGGGPGEVVLLLGDDPDDAERISAWLLARGARAQPVVDRFVALDELRAEEYAAFVIAVESIGPDPSRYLERIREAGAPLRIGFIAEPGAALPAWLEEEGTVVRRPLDEGALARLFPWVGLGAAPILPERSAAPPRGPAPRPREPVVTESRERPPAGPPPRPPLPPPAPPPAAASPPGSHSPSGVPDWLAAVRAILEASRGGGSLVAALRAWAEREPACAGWGEVREEEGTLSLRAGGSDRAALLAALAAEVAALPEAPLAPTRRGGFACLPGEGAWTALWWRDPESGGRGFERLAGLLPLVEELRPHALGNLPAGSAPRDRLLRLLDARMHAVRRHGGALALILIEPSAPAHLLPLVDALATGLRGEDWLEIDAGRLWVLLERPDATVAPAIAARLRALPAGARLRAVGVSWRPGGDGAAALLARLEAELLRRAEGEIDWAD